MGLLERIFRGPRPRPSAVRPELRGAVDEVIQRALAIAPSVAALGTYDPTTGTWTVSINLDTGAAAELRIQFRTAAGGRQQFYNPVTTASIHVAGSGERRVDIVCRMEASRWPSV